MSSGGHGGGDGELELPGLHDLHMLLESSNGTGGFIVPGWLLILAFAAVTGIFAINAPVQSALDWDMLLNLGPLWLPLIIGRFAFLRFLNMRQMNFNRRNPFVLLEVRMPREVSKTPQAMETVVLEHSSQSGRRHLAEEILVGPHAAVVVLRGRFLRADACISTS